jgi:hypothetical protein
VLQVFAIEVLLKLGVGLALAIMPFTVIKLLGLPRSEGGFWPRLLGATLIGLSAALYMESRLTDGKGLALAGAIVINLIAATMIAAHLIAGQTGGTTRGRLSLWIAAAVLVALSAVEMVLA